MSIEQLTTWWLACGVIAAGSILIGAVVVFIYAFREIDFWEGVQMGVYFLGIAVCCFLVGPLGIVLAAVSISDFIHLARTSSAG